MGPSWADQLILQFLMEQFDTMPTVNVLKLRTLKIIIFPAVRYFRNYVSEKVLVFVILECGLYHEQKWFICM